MGLLDSVIGALSGARGGGGQGDLLSAVVGMLANNGNAGGAGDLVGRFRDGGLGHIVDSWIGTGGNLPISAEQLQSVLGSDTVADIANQLGLPPGDTADRLTQMLPYVLDKLTPQGRLPDGGLGDAGELLGRLARR